MTRPSSGARQSSVRQDSGAETSLQFQLMMLGISHGQLVDELGLCVFDELVDWLVLSYRASA